MKGFHRAFTTHPTLAHLVQEGGNTRTTSQQLKQLSNSSSTLKGTARDSVGFSLLSLLDNGFSRWRWCGMETSALLH